MKFLEWLHTGRFYPRTLLGLTENSTQPQYSTFGSISFFIFAFKWTVELSHAWAHKSPTQSQSAVVLTNKRYISVLWGALVRQYPGRGRETRHFTPLIQLYRLIVTQRSQFSRTTLARHAANRWTPCSGYPWITAIESVITTHACNACCGCPWR